MSLKSIQLAHIDPIDRAAGKFRVTVWSDDQNQLAVFDVSSERDGIALRNALRQHADRLVRAADYRHREERKNSSLRKGARP